VAVSIVVGRLGERRIVISDLDFQMTARMDRRWETHDRELSDGSDIRKACLLDHLGHPLLWHARCVDRHASDGRVEERIGRDEVEVHHGRSTDES
jgi:hypothetical protein